MLDFSVTFIITIVNIAILYFILRKILFKRVTKFMAARAQKVKDTLAQADNDRVKAGQVLTDYQDRLKNAGDEADGIIKIAREQAKAAAEKILADGQAAREALLASGRRQLESERQAMLVRFKLDAAALVMAASARLVQRDISGEDKHRYAALLLDELATQQHKG